MPRLNFHSDLCVCDACRRLERVQKDDRSDGERFITRENNRVFDRIPVAQVIKEKAENVLKYPGASEGIFAVY